MGLQRTDSYSKAYVEILYIISNMEDEYKNKIPFKLIEFFESNKDKNYIYSPSNNNTFLDKTISLLTLLEFKYWTNKEEKVILEETLKNNDIKYQKYLEEKYDSNNIFKNKDTLHDNITDNSKMIKFNDSLFKKIWNKILSIFKR